MLPVISELITSWGRIARLDESHSGVMREYVSQAGKLFRFSYISRLVVMNRYCRNQTLNRAGFSAGASAGLRLGRGRRRFSQDL
jgi:hypothetical protein